MNDSRPTERLSYPPLGSWSPGPGYPPLADPAYAEPAPSAPAFGGRGAPWTPGPPASPPFPPFGETNSTRQLPADWQDLPPPGGGPPEPPTPKGTGVPRWLWVAAGTALLLVVALVIALILANDAIRRQTAVPPLLPMPEPSTEMPSPPSLTIPSRIPAPLPPRAAPRTPTETPGPTVTQDVVYTVNGDGRAISIMYFDSGDVIQTEFNVALPWSKEVSLGKSARHPANVTVVNIGHNVTCSVTVNGVQVSQRVGVGLTICDARG